MPHAVALRRSPLRFGRRRGAVAMPATRWPHDGLPFFVRCWAGATALILIWVG